MSEVIQDLNDNCFALSTELLVQLCKKVEEEAGRKPTIKDLCELLAWGLRSCNGDILDDVQPADVIELVPKLRKSKTVVKTLTPGDVVAVPSQRGGYHFVVFIVSNKIGWGFGILRGRFPLKPPRFPQAPQVIKPPFYTHPEPIRSGRWPLVGNDPKLLSLFPAVPEVYYRNEAATRKLGIDVGEYGSAANPDTWQMRRVSEEEAQQVGLMNGTYRTSYLGELLEKYLDRVAG